MVLKRVRAKEQSHASARQHGSSTVFVRVPVGGAGGAAVHSRAEGQRPQGLTAGVVVRRGVEHHEHAGVPLDARLHAAARRDTPRAASADTCLKPIGRSSDLGL